MVGHLGFEDFMQNKNMSQTPTPVIASTREGTTHAQVNTVLSILGMTITAISHAQRDLEDLESAVPNESKRLPGEALVAAENTFVKACERLDSILDDSARWDSSFQMNLEADYKRAMDENIGFLQAQRKAAEHITLPQARMNPSLVRLTDGLWAAILGNPETPSSIIGIGPTAQEALDAFDESFNGRMTKFTQDWLQKHGTEAKNEQQETVDPRRNRNLNPPPKGRSARKRNRGETGETTQPSDGEVGSPS